MNLESELTIDKVLDDILFKLLPLRDKKPSFLVPPIDEKHIRILLRHMHETFSNESVMLKLEAPLCLAGDTHGQFFDLLRVFELGGHVPKQRYLFLGDYVDRGKYSTETICLLFALKLRYPNCIYMLRGNHEDASLNRVYGFYDELKRKYSVKLWKEFVNVFNMMPVAALISNRILCMHGGLSPHMKKVAQIETIERPSKIPDEGLMCDLLWSDPEPNFKGWGPNERGVSYIFGDDVVEQFVKENDLDLICRAHQVVEDGYEMFANRKLITIFSAPNYCNEFTNSASLLKVDKSLSCSIHILEPNKKLKSKRV